MTDMTHPIREAAKSKAEALAQSILRLTTHYEISMAGYDEMITAINNALLTERAEQTKDCAFLLTHICWADAVDPTLSANLIGALLVKADEIEKEIGHD